MSKRKWTEDEEVYLEYYGFDGENKTYESAEKFLKRSNKSIKSKISDMKRKGFRPNDLIKRWSTDEEEFLKKHYGKLPRNNIALRLKRTPEAVCEKARLLGLSKKSNTHQFDAEIRKLASQGFTRREISQKLGISYNAVRYWIHRHDINCVKANHTEAFSKTNDLFFKKF